MNRVVSKGGQSPNTCFCQSNIVYSDCCGKFHRGLKQPDTAEQLMRARFSAFAVLDGEFLLSTWSSKKRPNEIDLSDEKVCWKKLEILNLVKGGAADITGEVEFKAYYVYDGMEFVMHEISRFSKESGRWYYQDGLVKSNGKLHENLTPISKNASCPCGSGKKYKRCCGNTR